MISLFSQNQKKNKNEKKLKRKENIKVYICSCCWAKGLLISWVPSDGQINMTEVPLRTVNPKLRVLSEIL